VLVGKAAAAEEGAVAVGGGEGMLLLGKNILLLL
jgi:hypothetical protein